MRIIFFLILATILVYGCSDQTSQESSQSNAKNTVIKTIVVEGEDEYEDTTVFTDIDNPDILEARRKAQNSINMFISSWIENSEDSDIEHQVYADFGNEEEIEGLWVLVNNYDNSVFYGTIINYPIMEELNYGDFAEVPRNEVNDGMILDVLNDKAIGFYTKDVLENIIEERT